MFGNAIYTPRFKPYSFQELIQPLELYKQEADRLSDAYGTLSNSANQFSAYLQPGSKSYETMQQYNQGLQQTLDELSESGYLGNARSGLNKYRQMYSSQILPIQTAAQTFAAQQKMNNEYKAKGILAYNSPSVDDLLQNPSATSQYVDLNKVAALGQQLGTQMSTENIDWTIHNAGAYDMYTQKQGILQSAIPELMNSNIYQNGVQRVLAMYNDAPDDVKQQIASYYGQGFASGISQKIDNKVLGINPEYKEQLEFDSWKKKYDIQLQGDLQKLQAKANASGSNAQSPIIQTVPWGNDKDNNIGYEAYMIPGSSTNMYKNINASILSAVTTNPDYKKMFTRLNSKNKAAGWQWRNEIDLDDKDIIHSFGIDPNTFQIILTDYNNDRFTVESGNVKSVFGDEVNKILKESKMLIGQPGINGTEITKATAAQIALKSLMNYFASVNRTQGQTIKEIE